MQERRKSKEKEITRSGEYYQESRRELVAKVIRDKGKTQLSILTTKDNLEIIEYEPETKKGKNTSMNKHT